MLKAHCNSKGLCYKTDVDINLHIPPDRGIGVGWGGGGVGVGVRKVTATFLGYKIWRKFRYC